MGFTYSAFRNFEGFRTRQPYFALVIGVTTPSDPPLLLLHHRPRAQNRFSVCKHCMYIVNLYHLVIAPGETTYRNDNYDIQG